MLAIFNRHVFVYLNHRDLRVGLTLWRPKLQPQSNRWFPKQRRDSLHHCHTVSRSPNLSKTSALLHKLYKQTSYRRWPLCWLRTSRHFYLICQRCARASRLLKLRLMRPKVAAQRHFQLPVRQEMDLRSSKESSSIWKRDSLLSLCNVLTKHCQIWQRSPTMWKLSKWRPLMLPWKKTLTWLSNAFKTTCLCLSSSSCSTSVWSTPTKKKLCV